MNDTPSIIASNGATGSVLSIINNGGRSFLCTRQILSINCFPLSDPSGISIITASNSSAWVLSSSLKEPFKVVAMHFLS